MAAISAARGAPTALTPPSSSHGDEPSWRYRNQHEETYDESGAGYFGDESIRNPRQNGNFDSSYDAKTRKMHSADTLSNSQWDAHAETGVQSPQFDNIRSDWSTGEPETDEMTRGRADSMVNGEVESKWIHRDILAQIESEELQAAGFIPRSRAPSKQRRDKSARRGTDAGEHLRLKQDPGLESGEASKSALDLRTQEEAADEQENNSAQNAKGGSRIPVPKTRSRSASATLRELTINVPPEKPKPAQRSATETSPKKIGAAGRKNSEPANAKPKTAAGRPKTRSGPSKDSTTTRPTTRSGEASLGSSRQPEGNPPWMVNSYNPDPRLPPEKQLIPTVAKRLQQEKWEQEGTFGTAYDKDFRPLNDSALVRENSVPLEEREPKQEQAAQEEMEIRPQTPEAGPSDEWPLKADAPKSPQIRLGSSYSAMPKISDMPKSPLPGQRPPMTPQGTQGTGTAQSQSQLSEKPQTPQRIPEVSDDQDQKGGCGCCVVM
ncbi:hypothetical protein TGAMA5MH_08020 [Trichoderma gamsii]|uniref:TeaA receptor TeaR n=1 Tax=Trichoderma gamsii TaxID=398673 RepID=A0A2K0T3J4_9HYPO|nr:hypothetical protein TGAMA5MH_08020 [Trichoderma gamsii]